MLPVYSNTARVADLCRGSLMDGHTCWQNMYKVIYSPKLYDLTRWAELMIGPDQDLSNPAYPLPEPLAVMQPEPGKSHLTGILIEGNAAILRNPIVPSMNMEEVKMFTAPSEGQ